MNLYGKPLEEWNRLAGLSGAQAIDIEITARGHRCGTFRMSKDGTAETGSRVDWDAMSAGQRLLQAFDLNAPCCTAKASWLATYEAAQRARKRSLREVMADAHADEFRSTLVRGRSPKQLVREAQLPGWE